MSDERRFLPDDDYDQNLHGGKILRKAEYDRVPLHSKVMLDHRKTLARLDRAPAATLAQEALALLTTLTAGVAEDLRAPKTPPMAGDEGPGFAGKAELDAMVKVLDERDTDSPGSARQAARSAIADYLAHRALLKALGHSH